MQVPKCLYGSVATYLGATIGAGILAIPFVVAKAGLIIGFAHIIILGLVVLAINLMVGEISLRTPGNHQLTGYAEIYLGKVGKWLMTFSIIVGVTGAIVAYTIGSGISLSAIFGGSSLLWGLSVYAFCALVVYSGLHDIIRSEMFMLFLKFGLLALLMFLVFRLNFFSLSTIPLTVPSQWLAPYGVILFAFLSTIVIPEMREEMRNCWRGLKTALIIGSLLVIIIYLIFTFVVLGTTGINTTEIATIGLGAKLGAVGLIIVNLFAVLAMIGAFIPLSYALKSVYHYDYKFSNIFAWLLTFIVPLLIIAVGLIDFIKNLALAGAVAGALDGILIILMFLRARRMRLRRPEFSITANWFALAFLMTIFLLGFVAIFA